MLFIGPDPVLLLIFPFFLLVLTVHECAHAWMANLLGDPTAKEAGRLSLNPFAHLDWLGVAVFFLLLLGWGKPVPVNADRLRPNRQVGMALVGVAGPASNFVLAALVAIPLRLHLVPFRPYIYGNFRVSYGELVSLIIFFNLAIGLFNLIPFTPLDGSRLLAMFLPTRWFDHLARLELPAFLLLLTLVIVERVTRIGLLSAIILPPVNALWWLLVGMSPPFPLTG